MNKEKEETPFQVLSRYDVWVSTDVGLPEGKTPDDVEWVTVKWGEGEIGFKDGTIQNFEEKHSEKEIHLNFKYPEETKYGSVDKLFEETMKKWGCPVSLEW